MKNTALMILFSKIPRELRIPICYSLVYFLGAKYSYSRLFFSSFDVSCDTNMSMESWEGWTQDPSCESGGGGRCEAPKWPPIENRGRVEIGECKLGWRVFVGIKPHSFSCMSPALINWATNRGQTKQQFYHNMENTALDIISKKPWDLKAMFY